MLLLFQYHFTSPMLLLLKERVPNVSIRNCNGYARRVLQLANFERLFDID